VSADQIVRLRGNFTTFVNALLATELAAAGQCGTTLRATHVENRPDGGVDAQIVDATGTEWVPSGDSAWQFKQGDLGPTRAAAELREATWAQELIGGGAGYRLALGAALNARTIASRKAALVEEARTLGLPASPELFDVLDANALARWATNFPSLAVAGVLGGPGMVATDWATWAESNRFRQIWTPDDQRDTAIQAAERFLDDPGSVDLRVDGNGGVGKTRLVLEALRGHSSQPLVAYVPSEAHLQGIYLNHLLAQRRTVVVVVDECDGRRHEKLAEQIPTGSTVKLITIGQPDDYLLQSPVITLSEMATEDVAVVLERNSMLWPEARRFVAQYSDGNVRQAFWLANKVGTDPNLSAATVLDDAAFRRIMTRDLPGGDLFLGAAVLALVTRIGWDDDLSRETELLSERLDVKLDVLKRAGAELERKQLLGRQGRYRLVEPHPVATFLAIEAWRTFGDKIINSLVPALDTDLAHRLFRRAADIGYFEPTRSAVSGLLGPQGPFASLPELEAGQNAQLLVEMAVVAPDEVAEHIDRLLRTARPEQIRDAEAVRRPLVVALMKLAWHSRLFDQAADDLLLLALNENETWSNNATGVWTSLFGAALPATSATPEARAAYLADRARSEDVEVRRLCVRAAPQGLSHSEFVLVEGELQAGVVAERRGTPTSYAELYQYQATMIELLSELATDSDATVAEEASQHLFSALHPLLNAPEVLPTLIDALLADAAPERLRRLRSEVNSLEALFTRAGPPTDGRMEGLAYVRTRLPDASDDERLDVLAHSQRWDFADGQLEREILDLVRRNPERTLPLLLTRLTDEPDLPANFEFGKALAVFGHNLTADTEKTQAILASNFPAVVGYLWGLREVGGEDGVFDNFIDSPEGQALDPATRLALTVRGPLSDVGLTRVRELLGALEPGIGARGLFGWHTQLPDSFQVEVVRDWSARIETQPDYNSVIDLVAMFLHRREPAPGMLELLLPLLQLRAKFPDVGQEAWDWARLAERLLEHSAREVLLLLLDGIEAGAIRAFPGDEDNALLVRAVLKDVERHFPLVAERVLAGAWRLAMDVRGVITDEWPTAPITDWIGDDVERARTVAQMAGIGGARPSAIARFLLDTFPGDEDVQGALYGTLVTGSWTGNESIRLSRQIEQLQDWIRASEPSSGVAQWATRVITSLSSRRETVLQEEAERGF
jgi:hypothetical protein